MLTQDEKKNLCNISFNPERKVLLQKVMFIMRKIKISFAYEFSTKQFCFSKADISSVCPSWLIFFGQFTCQLS